MSLKQFKTPFINKKVQKNKIKKNFLFPKKFITYF